MNGCRAFRFLILLVLLGSLLLPGQIVLSDDLPDSAYISGFIGYAQNYSITCEIRSATDVAAFWGVHFTEDEFINKLPFNDNPNVGFVGNINGYWGNIPPLPYGVHAIPIVKTLKEMGLKARDTTGMGKDSLKREIVAGRPVIVWVIGGMWNGTSQSYTSEAGEETIVARYEHTMVVTGYDEYTVQVVDPGNGRLKYFYWSSFMSSWSVLGNMSAVVDGKVDEGDLENPTDSPQISTLMSRVLPNLRIRR